MVRDSLTGLYNHTPPCNCSKMRAFVPSATASR